MCGLSSRHHRQGDCGVVRLRFSRTGLPGNMTKNLFKTAFLCIFFGISERKGDEISAGVSYRSRVISVGRWPVGVPTLSHPAATSGRRDASPSTPPRHLIHLARVESKSDQVAFQETKARKESSRVPADVTFSPMQMRDCDSTTLVKTWFTAKL
ncbi:hypothetical protein J6590_004671 [Homalodisca vitripennis]|nr:hypothetical protein J6590_004671 [Homalodisca vitripennis]